MSSEHRTYFNRLAPEWDDLMDDDPALPGYLQRFGISPGNYVLDVGAGTGRLAKHLCRLTGNRGLVVAQDFAEKMLSSGKIKLAVESHIVWLCDNIEALALKDNIFDRVICYSAFPHFGDKKAALKEMLRVLAPGGKLLILHSSSSKTLNEFHANLEGPVRNDRLPETEDMIPLLLDAGLHHVHVEENDRLYWAEGVKINQQV